MNEIIENNEGGGDSNIIPNWVSKLIQSVWQRLWIIDLEYPKWKHLVSEFPNEQEAREAFKYITRSMIIMDDRVDMAWINPDGAKVVSNDCIEYQGEIYTLDELGISPSMYYNAWYYPEECTFLWAHSDDMWNEGLTLELPNWEVLRDSWFAGHTDTPSISKSFFYTGCWPNWSVDNTGKRFYYIDKSTGLPANWEWVQAREIFRNYMVNVLWGDMKKLVWKS